MSLDGSIEKYFAKEDMAYDRETCTFSISHETARDVLVEGKDSLEYRLFCKALARNGIKAVRSAEGSQVCTAVSVRLPGDGTFRLIEDGRESVKAEKIGQLIGMIVPAITKHQISVIREKAEMTPYE